MPSTAQTQSPWDAFSSNPEDKSVHFTPVSENKVKPPGSGPLAGKIWISDNFNDPLTSEEFYNHI